MSYTRTIQELIDQFGRLPGIGPKSAQRISDYILMAPKEEVQRLVEAVNEAKDKVRFCDKCFNFSEEDLCMYCADLDRDPALVCVVEEAHDIEPIERTREFRGRYHVLQGRISPIEGRGPDQLRIKELLARLDDDGIKEVILATNPNIEGEATAMYIARLLKSLGVVVSRIASGLPVGGDLEYADEVTLGRAMTGRREVEV